MANEAHLPGPALPRHVDGHALGDEGGAGLQAVVEAIGDWVIADVGASGDDPVDAELHADHLGPPGVETAPQNQPSHSPILLQSGAG